MGIFNDKSYDDLDWLSKATEPIDSHIDDIIAFLPDSKEIDFDFFLMLSSRSEYFAYSEIRINIIVDFLLKASTNTNVYQSFYDLAHDQKREIMKCFAFETEGNPLLDFEKKTIHGGTIIFKKISNVLSEKQQNKILGSKGIYSVKTINLRNFDTKRAKEIIELIDISGVVKNVRSANSVQKMLVTKLSDLFIKNEWKIKNTELADKVGLWITSYIVDGNLSAYTNFCKLKVMTHKNDPIYSMEEV